MGCPSSVEVGENLIFSICTHDPDTGVLTDADEAPTYRVYEDETATPILTGSMAKLDDDNTTGFYTETIACTAGNGFENGKTYTIYIQATVDSDTGGISFSFKAITTDSKIDIIDSNVDAILVDTGTTLQAELDGIQADTEDLQAQIGTAGAGLTAIPWNSNWDTEIQSECTDALNAYDPPTKAEMDTGHGLLATEAKQDIIDANVDSILEDTGTTLPASIGALNDLSAAEVNAQVLDVLNTDTFAEPGQEAPPATTSLVKKIGYLYKFLRNKITNDGTTVKVYNDASDTVDHKSTVSEADGTVTRGEFGTGP